MEFSTDPYEQKLYQLFKSYEAQDCGIDRAGLMKLCTNLELKERGDALVNLLGMNNINKQRVDFHEFRAALLQILGEEINKGKWHCLVSQLHVVHWHPDVDTTASAQINNNDGKQYTLSNQFMAI